MIWDLKSNMIFGNLKIKILFDLIMGIKEVRDTLKDRTCYLSCAGRLDGVGAQTWASISTMIAAEYLGFTYVHSPSIRIDHNDMNVPVKKWNTSWENIMRIHDNTISIDDWKKLPKKGGRKVLMEWHSILRRNEARLGKTLLNNYCFIVKESHQFVDMENPELRPIIEKICRQLQSQFNDYQYAQTPNLDDNCDWFSKDQLDVAIHIRRGDVAEWNITKRLTANSYFMNTAKQLHEILKTQDKKVVFHIFSEGNLNDDFPELSRVHSENNSKVNRLAELKENPNIQFRMHLNGDARKAFLHLTNADILVTSKSCFSYVAAVLNKKAKILFTEFWFPSLSNDWITLNSDGSLPNPNANPNDLLQ